MAGVGKYYYYCYYQYHHHLVVTTTGSTSITAAAAAAAAVAMQSAGRLLSRLPVAAGGLAREDHQKHSVLLAKDSMETVCIVRF